MCGRRRPCVSPLNSASDSRRHSPTKRGACSKKPSRRRGARPVEATGGLPAHCAVKGYLLHGSRIGFAAALPVDWNGKFLFYGIGGFAGVINPLDRPPSDQGLKRGYATATTDTGHQSPTVE